jgi:hypothetical protein
VLLAVALFALAQQGSCIQMAARFDLAAAGPREASVPLGSVERLADVWNADLALPAVLAVGCSADWIALWDQLRPSGSPQGQSSSAPSVNFSEQAVLVMAWGQMNHGSTRVSIDSLVRFEHALIVYLTRIEPGLNCGVLGHAVSMAKALAVPRWDGRVHAVETRRQTSC